MRRQIRQHAEFETDVRDSAINSILQGTWLDVRLGIRALKATPVVSLVATLSLALGIGANTAIFSLINTVLLRALPVTHPEALVLVSDPGGEPPSMWSYAVWTQMRDRSHLFDGTLAYFTTRFNLSPSGEADMVDGFCVSGGFFRMLGIEAALGRALTEEDDRPGGDAAAGHVAVIGHGLWQRRFGGAADVVGRTMIIERVPFTIVGVLPRGFVGPVVGRTGDVMIPVASVPRQFLLRNPGVSWLSIMARLKPGQTIEAAAAALRAQQAQIREGALLSSVPGPAGKRLTSPVVLVPASRGNPLTPLRSRYRQSLLAMQFMVALVLLIACANIGNLMLARADARRHEMSTRIALGASRWRLIRQFLIESLVLATMGAMAAVLFARWAGRVLVPLLSSQSDPVTLDLVLDWRVLAFTAGIVILSATLFGAIPALRTSRVDPLEALKDQGRTGIGVRAGVAQSAVIVQVALSLVLLMGAGLFVRTFANLASLDLGFEKTGVLVVEMNGSTRRSNRPTSFDEVRKAVSALPDVSGVATAMMTPVTGTALDMEVEVVGAPPLPPDQDHIAGNAVSPGWFGVYKTAILAGRDFTQADSHGARPVAIVNHAFARRFLRRTSPIGRIVRQAGVPPGRTPLDWEIVGMVADTAYESLRAEQPPMLYHTFAQFDQVAHPDEAYLSLRSATVTPLALRRSVAAAISQVNPDLVLKFLPLADIVNASISQERALALLVTFFGGLALLLSALGIYGVTSYSVTRRRAEIGIRVVLGASHGAVMRLVLSRVTLLIVTGLAIGAIASMWLTRLVTPLLFGLGPGDPATLATAALVLVGIGTLAGWFPVYRVARIPPSSVLREQ
jgi:putative ABC transport system permease protein